MKHATCHINKRDNFTMLDNDFINDTNISFKAKGIFIYFVSKKKPIVKVRYVASFMKDKEASIYSGLKELENAGYLIRKKQYDKGKICGIAYHFDDMKIVKEMLDEQNK
jgi:predicted transcriptional regulator